ncbi:5' nucleotidase, NT5C type [Peribacillus kribbensis]|uniref:5' nucleotidase, NT5C type n=1 Tax=Peribacillus kribbensis TaxID=356658 RepID=UPI0003F8D03C|nr:HAD family acid phosphatase [Peribacillus kribbensis]
MKFGFDIDDTLINLREHAFHIYKEKLKKDIPIEVFKSLETVEIHEAFGLSAEQGKHMWESTLEEIYFTACPPLPEAVQVLQILEQEGHEIFYITARGKAYGERTKEWMKQQGFPVQEDRFFCGMKDHEKVHVIRDLHLDYYFDDKPAILETLLEEGIQLYLMNQSYNQTSAIPRISSWEELKGILEKHA